MPPLLPLPPAGAGQATLRLRQLPAGTGVDHGTAYGRLAFSCPTVHLRPLQDEVAARGYQVLTPLVRLDTPGKAAVQVVILADPDGHEVRLWQWLVAWVAGVGVVAAGEEPATALVPHC